ncbi:uncharacterized protein isoform X2 [Rhodnius prolixus]
MLMCAATTAVTEIVSSLLAHGADPNYHSGEYTPLMCLCQAMCFDDIQLIQCFYLLVNAGAEINARDHKERTPLMLAAKYHQSHLLTCLLTHGADVNAISANGWNAMFYAVCSGEPQVVRVLKRAGCRWDLKDRFGLCAVDVARGSCLANILDGTDNYYNLASIAINNKNLIKVPMPETVYKGFQDEVIKIIGAVGLKYLIPLFMQKKVGYGQFLLNNNREWKELGIEYRFDREKLLYNANYIIRTCWGLGFTQILERNALNSFWLHQISAMCNEPTKSKV